MTDDPQKAMAVSSEPEWPQVEGYRMVEQLYRAQQTAIYRGVQESQQRNVIVKLLYSDNPNAGELVNLCNQCMSTCNLSTAAVVRPLELKLWHHGYAVVMEDSGGMTLGKSVCDQTWQWQDVLAIALQITDILHDLHQAHATPRNIQPANLLIHPKTKQIQLIDFSLTPPLPTEIQERQKSSAARQDILAYLAPEQISRAHGGTVDYRADFYALGVTLYELLAGQLPFCDASSDGVNDSLAQTFTPVNEVNAQVPAMLATIVEKLMAHNVEDRYQSALALKHDLQQCDRLHNASKQIEAKGQRQQDVSRDRKHAEQPSRLSTALAKATFELVTVGFAESDLTNGKIIRTNDRFCRMTGYTAQELESLTVADLTYPDDISTSLDQINQLQIGAIDSFTVEKRYVRKDRSFFWANTTVSLIQSLEEDSPRCLAVVQDISDRKAAELALKESQERFQRISENIPGMIYRYVLHADGSDEMSYASSQIREIYELEPDALLTDTALFWERIHPEDIAWLQKAVEDSTQTLRAFQVEYRVMLPQKGLRWIQMFSQPKRLENGDVIWDGMAIDITDRKVTQLALQNAQDQFLRITEKVPGMIYRHVIHTDGSDELLYMSSQVREIYELEPEIVLQTPSLTWERKHPDDIPWLREQLYTPSQELKSLTLTYRLILPKKGLRWVENVSSLERLDNGDVIWDGVVTDITERKEAEFALQQSEEKFRTLVSNLHGAVYRSQNDTAWTINYMSDAIFDLSGYPASDFIENNVRTYASIIHPDNTDYVDQEVAQAIAKQESFLLEYRIIHQDGSIRWVYEKGKGIFDQENQLQYLEGVIFDISDRKRYEQEILKSRAFLQTILDTVPLSVFWKDCDSRFIGSNQNFAEDAGFDNAEAIAGLTDFDMPWAETEAVGYQEDDQEIMQSDSPKIGIIETQVQADGTQVWLETNKLPLHDLEGYVIGVMGTYQDISDRKRAEAELQRTNAELIRATRLKDEFLANMSHELRTPLNSVIGFSQLMQRDSSLSEQHKETLNTINRSGEYLLSLINDILEMSKIEAGRTTLNLQPVDLPQLLDELRDMLQIKADAKHLYFDFSYAADLPNYIQTDEVKLRQIVLNLLSNALKFTKQGRVTFHAEILKPLPVTEGKVRLKFSVADTGPGISAEGQKTIFQPFVQASAGKYSHQGTGLGLPISQKFAEMMEGQLSVHSIEGQGSTFHCEICVDVLSAQTFSQTSDPKCYQNIQGLKDPQARYRLLVVDDNPDNSSLLLQMLSIPGFELKIACNGMEAVECNQDWQPDLIWMDIRMPVMDGLEAVRQIRRSGHQESGHQPIIIAITANAFTEEREAALAMGCDDFISKPFATHEVFERLEQWLKVEFLLAQEEEAKADILSTPTPQSRDNEEFIQDVLRSMPKEWQVAFRHAVRSLNDKAITSLLSEVPKEQQTMVDSIAELQKNFRYDILVTLIESVF